jgi:hypothetical protein
MQIYADFLSFFFLPNLRATSAQGPLIYDHLNQPSSLGLVITIPHGAIQYNWKEL